MKELSLSKITSKTIRKERCSSETTLVWLKLVERNYWEIY